MSEYSNVYLQFLSKKFGFWQNNVVVGKLCRGEGPALGGVQWPFILHFDLLSSFGKLGKIHIMNIKHKMLELVLTSNRNHRIIHLLMKVFFWGF